jgi:hypothetical protein
METFKDEANDCTVTLILGGKVLVLDVNFLLSQEPSGTQVVNVSSVKTSYAITNDAAPNADGPVSLDGFLHRIMQAFCQEVQKPEELRSPLKAADFASDIQQHLRYLVMLDRLAQRKDDGGIRWFHDVDQLCTILDDFAKREIQAISAFVIFIPSSGRTINVYFCSSLSLHVAPLDIFLLRSHALPMPYLVYPSLSFLIYITPAAYLNLRVNKTNKSASDLQNIDIPFSLLRSYVVEDGTGITLATLCLSRPSGVHLFPEAMSMPTLTSRPTFSLVPSGSELEHVFPQLSDLPSSLDDSIPDAVPTADRHTWLLDFTSGGKKPGIVMSRSRMRDLELVVNPLSGMDAFGGSPVLSLGTSWVDLLVCGTIYRLFYQCVNVSWS